MPAGGSHRSAKTPGCGSARYRSPALLRAILASAGLEWPPRKCLRRFFPLARRNDDAALGRRHRRRSESTLWPRKRPRPRPETGGRRMNAPHGDVVFGEKTSRRPKSARTSCLLSAPGRRVSGFESHRNPQFRSTLLPPPSTGARGRGVRRGLRLLPSPLTPLPGTPGRGENRGKSRSRKARAAVADQEG